MELRLDGAVAATLRHPPWRAEVDLGAALLPRRLEAVARDASGRELGRARQWLNLPRPAVEASLAVRRGADGRPVAALVAWEDVGGGRPQRVEARFDGIPLAVSDPRRIELPPHDSEQAHLLSVELSFAGGGQASVDAVLGGRYATEVDSELTAIPLRLRRGRRLAPDDLEGLLTRSREPLEVVAVEAGGGRVLVVRGRGAERLRPRLAARSERFPARHPRPGVPLLPAGGDRFRGAFPAGVSARFLWPFPTSVPGSRLRHDLFPASQDFSREDGGLPWLLARVPIPRHREAAAPRLADAVAVAGLQAAEGNRPRAVVLMVGDEPPDASLYSPAAVRRYLAAVNVPLQVWAVDEASAEEIEAAWGPAQRVGTEETLYRAVERLRTDLERQRIVWVAGRHLPQEIELRQAPGWMRMAE